MIIDASQTYTSAVARLRGKPIDTIRIEDFELLTAIIAATRWRINHPGSRFTLYADSVIARFLESVGLAGLWDHVDTQALDAMPDNVNHHAFWAASKIYAYNAAPAGRAFLDLDLIIWEPLDTMTDPVTGLDLGTADLVATHEDRFVPQDGQPLTGPYNTPPGYEFPDWVRLFTTGRYIGANTSFVRVKDAELKEFYCHHALRFIEGNTGNRPHKDSFGFAHMCLAEQNYALDAAVHLGKSVGYLYSTHGVQRSGAGSTRALHLWGYKDEMRRNPAARADYIRRALDRIEREAPQWSTVAYGLLQNRYELNPRTDNLFEGTDITGPA